MATKVKYGKMKKVDFGSTLPKSENNEKKNVFVAECLKGFETDHWTSEGDQTIYDVNIFDIQDRKNNNFIKSKINELANSIKEIGLKQPIIVKSIGQGEDKYEKFEVIAGHRRLAAYKKLYEDGDAEYLKIPSLILKDDELEKEYQIYLETNTNSRSTTLYEALLNCDLEEIDFNDISFSTKYNNMFYPDGVIPRTEKYDNNSVVRYLERIVKQNFPSIDEIKTDTIRRYYHLIKNSSDELTKAILEGKISLKQAQTVVRVSKEKQPEIIDSIIFGSTLPKMKLSSNDENSLNEKEVDYYKEMLKVDSRLKSFNKIDFSEFNTEDWTANSKAYLKQLNKVLGEIKKLESMPKK